jgi:glycosyltransferase involved in cell wall biosynthesis
VADIPAVRSLVRDGVDARVVPVDDAAALTAAVADLLDDPAQRSALGEAGRRRAETEFAWDGIVDRWDAFAARAVARRRHGASAHRRASEAA